MKTTTYRFLSLMLAAVFAIVGLLFLLQPDAALRFMNAVGRRLGLVEAPLHGAGFYPALAVGYMYLVTFLAWMMARRPSERIYPLLLAQAKGASGILSLAFFALHRPFFIYLANGVVDLTLGGLAVYLYWDRKKAGAGTA
jgi:hypothetical protein